MNSKGSTYSCCVCDYIKDKKSQSKSHKPLVFIFWCIPLQSVTRKRQTRLLDWESTRFIQNLWSHKYVNYFWTSLSRDSVNKRAVALINSTATSNMNGIHHWNKILRVLKIAVLKCVAGAPKLVILLRKLILLIDLDTTQWAFGCLKSPVETLKHGVKYGLVSVL